MKTAAVVIVLIVTFGVFFGMLDADSPCYPLAGH